MSENNVIGVSVTASSAREGLERIGHLEDLGVGAAWVTSGGGGGEAIALLAAAAARTDVIKLGTSIVQTWSRHPVTLAQQVQVIDGLAPGRFRLGVGPSHQAPMETTFGADFRAPIGHLREYIHILRALMHSGAVEFEGRWYSANTSLSSTVDAPIMASALRPGPSRRAVSYPTGRLAGSARTSISETLPYPRSPRARNPPVAQRRHSSPTRPCV